MAVQPHFNDDGGQRPVQGGNVSATLAPGGVWPAGVLFDLDGTLVDSLGDLAKACNDMLAALALSPLTVDQVRSFIGQGADHLVACCLQATIAAAPERTEPPSHAQARAAFDRAYAACNGRHTTVFDGVMTGLTRLRCAGIRTAIVTNKPGQFVAPLLQAVGLSALIDTWVAGDTLAQRKPHPAPLLEVCRRWNLPPQRLAFVGDSIHDAKAARAASMRCWLVNDGYPGERTAQALVAAGEADGIVDSIDELAEWWTASQ